MRTSSGWRSTTRCCGRSSASFGEFREQEAELERFLATVLFTDIVDSTTTVTALGDRRWKEMVEAHHGRVRGQLARYRGTEIDTAGDGFLATYDGPRPSDPLRDRNGCGRPRPGDPDPGRAAHGEVEQIGEKVGGIAVNIGARVGAPAGASEVLTSQTVNDLVAGSGIEFEDSGEHELKGVPDSWRLYRVLDE